MAEWKMIYCLLFSDPCFLSESKCNINSINLIDFGCNNHWKTVNRLLKTIKYFLLRSDDAKFVLKRNLHPSSKKNVSRNC